MYPNQIRKKLFVFFGDCFGQVYENSKKNIRILCYIAIESTKNKIKVMDIEGVITG